MFLALALGCTLTLRGGGFDFYSHGPYDPAIPRPESLLGYSAGQHETDYSNQDRVVRAIVEAAPARAKYITYGKSTEGKPLRIVAISSPENIARLDSIRADIAALASGNAANRAEIVKRTPPIVWINECIHGDEPASFESAMWLIYTLAASQEPALQQMLDKAVVVVNPSYNPDGHERFVTWYNSVATGSTDPNAFEQGEPEIVYGRLNHYRFDMNRDRAAMSQPETRQEVAEFLRWHPQVYVDQHGQVSNYFFPPTAMSINVNVDRSRYQKWTEIFGRDTAKSFDAQGFSYYVKGVFDFYYPGYTDTWSTLSGAIGMTHETDGPTSLAMANSDGSLSTLTEAISKHFTSALAVIGSAAAHGPELLASFADFKQDQVSGKAAGKYKFVVARGGREELEKLQAQLATQQIQSVIPASPLKLSKARSLWLKTDEDAEIAAEHALVIPLAQPQGALVKALVEDVSDFEPEFVQEQLKRYKQSVGDERYPRPEQPGFYDLTAWGLLYAHALDGWWVESLPANLAPAAPAPVPSWAGVLANPSQVGFAIPPGEDASVLAFHLLKSGVRMQVTSRPMSVQGQSFPAGTFLIFKARNRADDDGRDLILPAMDKWAKDYRGELFPLQTSYPDQGGEGPGSETVSSVKKPSVAVVFGDDSSTTDFGSIWYLLERDLKLPFTPVRKSILSDDPSPYSCIVFPDGSYDAPSDKLKEWVQRGGCAVILGGGRWAMGDKGFFKLEQVKMEKDRLPGYLPGSIFKAELDPRSFLSYGYPHQGDARISVAVPLDGNRFFRKKAEGGGAVVFSSDDKVAKILSGWEWPEDTEKNLKGAVWLHDEPVGRGHVIWFASDPTQRAMWPGLTRMLLNAILLGPSG